MRVLSGRLKAVLVASLATIILVGVIGPSATLASDPPGLARFMTAIGHVESGGNYYARNRWSGAYGKYQIMPSSWRAWAGRYLGNPYARPTPANQEIVAAAKFRTLYAGLHSWRRVAYWWLTGSSRTWGWSYAATRYVNRVMYWYYRTTAPTTTVPQAALHFYSEQSLSILYDGAWRSASSSGYVGHAAKYATAAGATATFTAHRALFSKVWATAGKHSLTIKVVGTAGHPYVAIDEFAIAH